MFMSIALAALVAAQSAAPQSAANSQWVPLKKSPPAQVQQQAPAQPVIAPVAAPATPIVAPATTSAILRVGTEVPLRLSEAA